MIRFCKFVRKSTTTNAAFNCLGHHQNEPCDENAWLLTEMQPPEAVFKEQTVHSIPLFQAISVLITVMKNQPITTKEAKNYMMILRNQSSRLNF